VRHWGNRLRRQTHVRNLLLLQYAVLLTEILTLIFFVACNSVFALLQQGSYRVIATVRTFAPSHCGNGGFAFLKFLSQLPQFAPLLTLKEADLTIPGSFDDAIAGSFANHQYYLLFTIIYFDVLTCVIL